MLASTPRAEYPRPQFERKEWMNLNGKWQFQIDSEFVGKQDKLFESNTRLNGEIIVPFAPESKLSGVGNTDHMNAVWYKRNVEIPQNWDGKKVIINNNQIGEISQMLYNDITGIQYGTAADPFGWSMVL